MSSQSQNHTPSWKVNLTQKFNQAYYKKSKKPQYNNIKKQTIQNFEQQLQYRLKNFIPIHKEQLSQISSTKSNKKDNNTNNKLFSLPTVSEENNTKSSQKNLSNLNKDNNNHSDSKDLHSQELQLDYEQSQNYFDNIFTNHRVVELFNKHFRNLNKEQIGLQQFVNILQKQYFNQQKKHQTISKDIKQSLIQECRLLFCTTDQNIISLNAIELLTKKNDLKLIILQTIMQIKYQKRKEKLQQKYQLILQEIIQQQQAIKIEQQKLAKKKTKIQAQQTQIKKKSCQIKLQQKQLVQRQKQIKRLVQEKHVKLSQQLRQVYDKLYKQIQKKANAFERNAKNKLELIEKRVFDNDNMNMTNHKNNKNNNTNNSNNNQQSQISSLTSANHKLNNQLYLLRSKLKKTQRQLSSVQQQKDKQLKQVQNESNSLLKINTMLQGKLEKSRIKIKQLSQIMARIQKELFQYKQEVRERNREINRLQAVLLEKQHLLNSSSYDVCNNRINKNNIGSNKDNYQNNQNNYNNFEKRNQNFNQTTNQHLSLSNLPNNKQQQMIIITSGINDILKLIMQAFDGNSRVQNSNYNNNYINTLVTPPSFHQTQKIKLQQALINHASDIILASRNIFWCAVVYASKSTQLQTNQYINIFYMLQFIIKLFMAKFSFIKFQSLIKSDCDNEKLLLGKQFCQETNQISLEQFVDCLSNIVKGKNDYKISIEQKIKASSILLAQLQSIQQQQPNLQQNLLKQLNLNIVLLIFGINETFNFKTCKIQPIVKNILNLLTNIDQLSTFLNTKSKKQFIHKFYDQQLMTFLLWKYMSYGTNINQVSIFMDVLIQFCNIHQNFQQDITNRTNNPLFKTIYALENYKCFINFLIMNFTQKKLQKNNLLLRQTLQKVSIILQRFCYYYKGKINVSQEDKKRLAKIMKQLQRNQQFDDSMFKANMISIMQAINQNNQNQQ